MTKTVWGIVKNGQVHPETPLPEGARVQIVVDAEAPSLPPELQAEFEAWDRASANALDLVERLAPQDGPDAPG